ncbi:copia-type polyprotein [Trifolium medium]|uniref:Copia-type polyprotein n=1 Tax=Trifolium medium TaxID=97028 RepID=A0A392MLV9_9FABA|nr:copia-type polyprotein [Trifolium medium]
MSKPMKSHFLAAKRIFRYINGTLQYGILFPMKSHFLAAKRIFRYINGTLQYGILFPFGKGYSQLELIGHSDTDWCGDKIDRRSTTRFVFKLKGAPISWSSKKHSIVALPSCEAEYVLSIKLWIDNKSAINLAKNPIAHGKSKHIENRFYYLREQVTKNKIEVDYCPTNEQVADILTKAMKRVQVLKFIRGLGVVVFDNLN